MRTEPFSTKSSESPGSSHIFKDTGINRATAESWLSVLQASHLVFLVQPWFTNLNKRLIKTPKLYFCDPGLAAWFVGVRITSHVTAHPQRGALFENWVMTELLKAQTNRGIKPSLHFLRDKEGHEIDAFIETAPDTFQAVEIKMTKCQSLKRRSVTVDADEMRMAPSSG